MVRCWFIDNVLARRGFDIGMREALGTIVRYVNALAALERWVEAGIGSRRSRSLESVSAALPKWISSLSYRMA